MIACSIFAPELLVSLYCAPARQEIRLILTEREIKHLKYCKIKAQAGQLQRERNLTKHLLWGQRDRILIAAEVEEALLTQATCLGGKASRARTTKTIFKDGTFIFVYKSLKCCVVRNYCLLSVLATSFFTFETKKRNLFNSRVLLLEG